jgi:hypothetical protein
MAADKVDPVELTAAWTTLARKLELAYTAERRPEPSKKRSKSHRTREFLSRPNTINTQFPFLSAVHIFR